MIDYEKLKQAMELAHKLYLIKDEEVSMEINFLTDFVEYVLHIEYEPTDAFSNIDKLITRLQELTQSKEPYKKAYYLFNNNEIKCTYVHNKDGYAMCPKTHRECVGRTMYPSRQALIESQIAHWQSLLPLPFEGEIKGFGCSESIRKHHELEDDDHSEEKLEKVGGHLWRVKLYPAGDLSAVVKEECAHCGIVKDKCNHQRDPSYQGGTWDEIDIHHKCGEFYR